MPEVRRDDVEIGSGEPAFAPNRTEGKRKMTVFSLPSRVNRLALLSLSILLVSVSTAAAQSDPNAPLAPNRPFYQPVQTMPSDMFFTQHHSSTAFEGYARGRAAVIHAWGNYYVNRMQALILREQARALYRENRIKLVQALQYRNELWQNAREKERNDRNTRITEGQQQITQKRVTEFLAAYQLSADEFNATTGEITWPTALQDAKYQGVRDRVEELFRIQLGYGEPQQGTAKQLVRKIEDLHLALQRDKPNLSDDEFLAAAKFLAGLSVTAESLGKTGEAGEPA